jgi:hypothetical protein
MRENAMKTVLFSFAALLVLGASSLAVNTAHAHGGTQPEHGGVVQLVGDVSFELVARADGVELYVEDDGDEVTSADMAAKLSIVDAGAKSEVTLTPAAGNKFEAKGVKIGRGAKVVVQLTLKDKQSKIAAHFTVK